MAIGDLQPRARNIAQSATTSGTWSGTGGTVGYYYRLTVTAGATAGAAGNATGPIGATTFTLNAVTSATKLPAAGTTGTTTYTLQESTNGTTYTNTAITDVTVTRLPNAPTTSATQNFATTASDIITHAIVYTAGAAPSGTIEFAVSTTASTYAAVTGWTTVNSFSLTRGTTYYFWTRSAADALVASVQQLTVPYLATNFAVGTVTVGTNELTGGSTSNVSVSWTAQANHFYRVTRVDLTPTVIVIAQVSTSPQSLLNAETNDLPLEGVVAEYKIEVRRSVASGGDGVWADATGTNVSWTIQRIKEPTLDDTQDFDTSSASPISHTISLKLNGLGGTLQYGWNTTGTNSQASVTNWQTSPTFTNAFTRGSTYYFYARRSTDAADFDLSTAQVVPAQAVYGLRVYSTNGSKIVFDTTSLPMNLITCKLLAGTEITSQTLAAGATGAAVYVTGLTQTNGSSVFVVVRSPTSLNTTPPYTLTRQAGYFTITNNLTSSATFYFFAGRYK